MNVNKESTSPLKDEIISIGKHSGVYFIGQALSRAVGFFMIPVYTRYISPTNYGSMEMIEILAGAIGMLIALGVSESMPRFYYKQKDEKSRNLVISTIVIGIIIIGVPLVIIFLILAKYLSIIILDDPLYKYFLQVSIISVLFGTLCEVGYTYLRMMYMAKKFVLIIIAQLILALSLNIYFIVYLGLDILGIFYSTLITQSIVAIILIFGILKTTSIKISFPVLKEMVIFGLPMVPSRVGTMLGFVSNRFFLRWMSSPDPAIALSQVGLFSLGHKFGLIINRFVNSPFNSFWGPRRLELVITTKPKAKEIVARVCTYSAILTIYISLLLSSGIKNVIEIMADPSYIDAYVVVPFVALSYVALGLELHFSTGIIYSGKTKWLTYISMGSLLIVIIWNFIFIPRFGLLGAATSNLAGYAFRIILIYFISQRLYPIKFEIKRLFILFFSAVFIFTISQFIELHNNYLTLFLRIFFVGFYPIFLYFFNFYNEDEISFIKEKNAFLFLTIKLNINKLSSK